MAEVASQVVVVSSSCDNEQLYREYCDAKFGKSKTTPVLSREQLDKVIACLRDPRKATSKLRFYVKKNNLVRLFQNSKKEAVAKEDKNKKLKTVVCYEDFYRIIKRVHDIQTRHASPRKTFKAIQDQYALVPREAVEKYCSLCSVCRLRGDEKKVNPLKPVRAKRVVKREKLEVPIPTHDNVIADENISAVAGLYEAGCMCEDTVTENQSPKKSSFSMPTAHHKHHKVINLEHLNNRRKVDDKGYINGVDHQVQEMPSSASQAVEDEFDTFGRSIASQLRKLSLPRALRMQSKFQTLLTEERISDMQVNPHRVHSDTTRPEHQVYVYWQK